MSTVAKDFTLDESAAYPHLLKCRPRARLRHLNTGRTGLKVAEKMGKACLECSLSVSMSLALQIWEITAPCQPAFRETRVRGAESFPWYGSNDSRNNGPGMKSNITNNTASSGEERGIRLWKLQTTLFINSKQCFSFTIRVIKNSNIVLSAISCWSDNGTESTAEVTWRYLESTIQEGCWREEGAAKGTSCFCISVPPASGDNTQNRCTLRFNSLSKRLLFVPLCSFLSPCPRCFRTPLLTHQPVPLEASPTARKQQRSPSRRRLMTYITFSLRGGTAGLHVVCA